MRSLLCPVLECACAFMIFASNQARAQNCTPFPYAPQALAPCFATQRQVEVADLNGDQIPDLAITTNSSLQIELGSLDAAGVPTYAAGASYPTPPRPTGLAIADFNSDGILDIAVAIESGGLLVFRGLGTGGIANGTFLQYLSIFSGSTWEVHAADLNGDGILDLVASNESGSMLIYRGTGASGHGDGGFVFFRNIASNGSPRGFVIADLDGDGILDLAVANNTPSIAVHKGLGSPGRNSGDFLPVVSIPTGADASGLSWDIASADFNHDGHTDLVVTDWGQFHVNILEGSGGFGFTAHVRPFLFSVTSVATGDVNGDGHTDIVVPHTLGSGETYFSTFSTFINNFVPGGGFPSFSQNDFGGFNWGDGITLADVNLDGGMDVLVAGITLNSLQVFVTHCGPIPFQLYTLVLGQGVVRRSPNLTSYPAGSSVVLTAVRGIGNRFDGWTGDVVSVENPLTINLTHTTTVFAHFVPASYALDISADGPGVVQWDPVLASYGAGRTVTVLAKPNPGSHLDSWSGDAEGDSSPLYLTMDSSISIVAHFRADSTTLAVGDGPLALALAPIQPNPSFGGARAEFTLPQSARVRLEVFDASGRSVRRLADGEFAVGRHPLAWDGRRDSGELAAAGVYWVALKSDGRSLTQRFALLR